MIYSAAVTHFRVCVKIQTQQRLHLMHTLIRVRTTATVKVIAVPTLIPTNELESVGSVNEIPEIELPVILKVVPNCEA